MAMKTALLVLVVVNGGCQLVGRVPNSFVLGDPHVEGNSLGTGASSCGKDRSSRNKSRSALFCVELGHFVGCGG
jgi:hypothetical protein